MRVKFLTNWRAFGPGDIWDDCPEVLGKDICDLGIAIAVVSFADSQPENTSMKRPYIRRKTKSWQPEHTT
jgi:hypothetical protein